MDYCFVALKVSFMIMVVAACWVIFRGLIKKEEVITEDTTEETSKEDVGEEVVIPEFVLPEFIFKLDEYEDEKLVRTHYFIKEEGIESWKGTRSSKLMVTKYVVGEVVYSADTLTFGNYREEESLRASENEVFVVQCLTFACDWRRSDLKESFDRQDIIVADSAMAVMEMTAALEERRQSFALMHTWVKEQKVRAVKLAEVESYEVKFGAKRVIGTSDTM